MPWKGLCCAGTARNRTVFGKGRVARNDLPLTEKILTSPSPHDPLRNALF